MSNRFSWSGPSRAALAVIAIGLSAAGCRETAKDCNCVEPVPVTWATSSHAFETKVLVFGPATAHSLNAAAKTWFGGLEESERIYATLTHEAVSFAAATLAGYDVVVFINTNDDSLSAEQRTALEDFVHAGRGLVVVHSDQPEHWWARKYEGDRVIVASYEHDAESWANERHTNDVLARIRQAAGGGMFTRITLSETLQNPLAIAVRPDGGVYSIERTGQVRLWDAATGHERIALTLEVDTGYENGLLGLALDPEFADTGYVYLYASEPRDESTTEVGPPGRNVLARYTANADGSLDSESRTVLFTVPSERRCCHEGGQLAFAADGTLLLSVGDNTNPFESKGTAPLDARPGREAYNARRTAQNPFDPRGKILRFTRDGGVPDGNLFSDPEQGLPQIYVMGVRNAFRIAPDPSAQRLFFGDVGPDAVTDTPRGPRGLDELNLVTAPGNYGWPLCIGQNLPYSDADYAGNPLGPDFDCSDKVPAVFAYDYATPSIPALGIGYLPDGTLTGRTVIAGAVYRAAADAPFALPPRFDGQLLMAEWARDVLAAVATDEGALRAVDRLFNDEVFHRPIDIEVGPDGAIYVLEYGSGFWGDNLDARLSRIEYGAPATLSPRARIVASKRFGSAPLEVQFSALDSGAPEGHSLASFAWDLDGDGAVDAHNSEVTHTFTKPGSHWVSLMVGTGAKQSPPTAVEIIVGNAPPTVTIVAPLQGSRFTLDMPVILVGQAVDPEDGTIACEDLVWNIGLIHNTHSHPFATLNGCETSFVPSAEDHDSANDVLSFSIELAYTDEGGPNGEAPLTARQGLQFETYGH